jgi:uncharacterized membrane-anchored protein YhcB (DUF1043 family)
MEQPMMDLLANGGGVTSLNWTSILASLIGGIAAIIGVVVASRQFRTSAREQRELEKEVLELERARGKALAQAVMEAAEATEATEATEGEVRVAPKVDEYSPQVREYTDRIDIISKSALADETQFEIIRKYHAQGLAQSRASFWFSLAFASLGFFIIATAVLSINRSVGLSQQSAAVISLLAGTIIDTVAGLFFVQSGRAQKVMQEFFEKLRTDRKLEESLKLVDKVADPELQGKLQVLLALNFAEVKASHEVLSAVLSIPIPTSQLPEKE